MTCLNFDVLVSYADDQLTSANKDTVAAHVDTCDKCKEAVLEIQQLTSTLSFKKETQEDSDFSTDVMTLIRLGQATDRNIVKPTPKHRYLISIASAAVIIMVFTATLLLKNSLPVNESEPAFQARGTTAVTPSTWTGIQVLRQQKNGYEAVFKKIHPNDSIAFTYDNRIVGRYDFLMIFAVDFQGNVFWYYPSYTQEGENPKSIKIETNTQSTQLPDGVTHSLQEGHLHVFGIFTKQSLDVDTIEQQVENEFKNGSLNNLSFKEITESITHRIVLSVSNEE